MNELTWIKEQDGKLIATCCAYEIEHSGNDWKVTSPDGNSHHFETKKAAITAADEHHKEMMLKDKEEMGL